jgi:hypothetical protein
VNSNANQHVADAMAQLTLALKQSKEARAAVQYQEHRLRQMLGVWEESEEVAVPDGSGGFYIYEPWPQHAQSPLQGQLRHTSLMAPEYPETTDESPAD